MACQIFDIFIFLFALLHCYCIFFYLYPISIHCYCIFLYLYSISVHFYCMFFVSILYSIICIQCLFISIVYVSFLFYIRSFVFLINDLYAIVFHYYSMTSIYIPNFSFVFYIALFVLYNNDLYSIFSYLYLIFVHFCSIFLIYILSFHISIV